MKLMMRVTCFLFVFIASQSLRAQQVHFTSLTTNEGLSSNTVYCSFKDHLGFLWIGTLDGLNRYDGNQFLIYRHSFSDSTSIASNIVFSIAEDSTGNIWLATSTGISCWNRNNNRFKNFFLKSNAQIQSLAFAKIAFEPDGNIYAYSISSGGTLYVFNKKSNALIVANFAEQKKNSLKGRIFWCNPGQAGVVADSSLWLYNFRDKKFEEWISPSTVNHHVSVKSMTVLAVHHDSVWFTYWELHDIIIFDRHNNQWTEDKFQSLPVQTHFTFLVPAGQHHWWISDYDHGVIDFDAAQNKMNFYHDESSESTSWKGSVTFDYYEDNDHTIWFSTGEGLNFIMQSSFSFHFLEQEAKQNGIIHFSAVNNLACDSHNNLWIGLLDYGDKENGIIFFDVAANSLTQFQNSMMHDYYNGNLIWELLPLDSVAIVSSQLGAIQFNLKTKRFEDLSEKIAPAEVHASREGLTALHRDHSNHSWFGLWKNGIVKFDPVTKSEIHFYARATERDKQLSSENVMELHEDSVHQRMWIICRDDNKLNCIDENNRSSIYPITINGSELDKTLSCVTVDSSGNVWIGTLDNGIIFFDAITKQSTQISAADGLPSQTIHDCITDGKNKIWIYTPKGIAWIDVRTRVITTLHDNNLPAQFTFEEGPMLMDKKGILYFGNRSHVMYFDTRSIAPEKNITSPILTAVSTADSEKILSKKNLFIIYPNENYFTVHFVTPDLLRGREIQYSYQMKDYDPDWVSTGNVGEVRFNHIPPGNYQLQLRAQVSGQPWNGKFSSVNFQILPAYYQTWWFKLLMVLLGAILIAIIFYAYFSRRIARLKREQQIQSIRTRIAQDIHDDIGAGLTKIFMQSEMSFANQPNVSDEMKTKLQSISEQSRELVGKLGEVVWSADPKHDDLDSMLAYFRSYIHHFMSGLSFQYEILFPEKILNLTVNPDVRRNLFLILKEALNNCTKHSKAMQVKISFQQKEKEYELKIADDGIGISLQHQSSFLGGNGLNNMKNRAKAMNAKIEFGKDDLHGTIISIRGNL